jgi:LysR family glycine cleavage system transcriptional activator
MPSATAASKNGEGRTRTVGENENKKPSRLDFGPLNVRSQSLASNNQFEDHAIVLVMHKIGMGMPLDLPPLTWLRAFEATARHLSFTNAAMELSLTQAAVSKRVKSLELHLGHPLLVRRTRSLQLTKTGEAYLPKVHDAFERLAIGTREVFGGRRPAELTLRCAVSFAVNWLAPRLGEFLEIYRGKNIRIISSVWNDTFDSDAVDLDIQYGTGAWDGVKSHRLTWESITPLCCPSLARHLHRPDDLKDQRLLHVLGYQEGWGTWLKAAGAALVNPGQGLQLDTSLAAFALAASGGGIALGRHSLAKHERQSGRLLAPFDIEVPINEAFYLLEPVGGAVHPDAEVFVKWLLTAAAADRHPEAGDLPAGSGHSLG